MAQPIGAPRNAIAEVPADESAEPIVIRKLDRLETSRLSNSQGA